MKSYLTVEEVLTRNHFEQTEVIAGLSGLNRYLKWVHVVESVNISNLLKGGELILTTGIGWKDEPDRLISLVQQLINCRAAGLCIEMDTHITEIPKDVIDLADAYHFPIVLFHHEVPFVEITQDVHSLIINKQYQLLTDLEQYSQHLNKMLLEIDNYRQILTYLHSYLDVQVITLFNGGMVECTPSLKKRKKEELLESIKSNTEPKSIKKTIQLLGDTYAEVVIFSCKRQLNHFDSLVLDRTVTALGQFLLRDLYVNEKKIKNENEWLTSWLKGEYSEELIYDQLSINGPANVFTGGIVWICKLNEFVGNSSNKDISYFTLLSRTVSEQNGFYLFSTEFENHLVVITLDKRNSDTWKQRMTTALQRIHNNEILLRKGLSKIQIGAGQYVSNLVEIHKSYKTAKETINLREQLDEENKSYFYQDLHMYRMMSVLRKQGNLDETVIEYLEPVIEYDRKYNGELLTTLKMYLECNGSKQETSKRLYIVRQTLYHRIEKLENLLGGNFMSPQKRLPIEFMLFAYDFLATSKQERKLKSAKKKKIQSHTE